MYGGDGVGALVFDVGSSSSRVGFAGENSPKFDVPSTVGIWLDSNDKVPQKRYNIGVNATNVLRSDMEMTSFLNDGMIEDWDTFESFLDYMYTNMLRVFPKDHSVFVTEPSWNAPAKREQIAELMFEKFSVPAMFLAKNAIMVAFGNMRPHCLVVDSGATHTTAVPIYDGYAMTKAMMKSPAGGDYLSIQCSKYLTEKGVDTRVVPSCMVASKEKIYRNVVVTGGNANLRGFTERLQWELDAKTPPGMHSKIVISPGGSERKFDAWYGCSTLAAGSPFQHRWLSKEEYEDWGKGVIHSKYL